MPNTSPGPTGLNLFLRASLRRAGGLALLLFLHMHTPQAMAAVPEEWKKTPYAYDAVNRTLRDFLEDLAHSAGLQLQIEGELEGAVHGKIRSNTLFNLMERLALEHRFQWFVYNNTLYISSLSQQTSERLEVAEEAVSDLKQALIHIGLLDDRFGWGELPEIGQVLVSGPKRYVEQIKSFTRKDSDLAEKQDVLTFSLQFANAADRQIDYRGEKLTVPGIASLLRGLLDPASANKTGVLPSSQMMSKLPNLPASTPYDSTLTDIIPPGLSKVRVEADVRNNSVLIYDLPQRNALYQTLIAKLDVARKLVEIDAVILDINRTQLKELGVNWGFQNSRFGTGMQNLAAGSSSTLSITNRSRFAADIRALEERGLATVISNPSIMTLENQPAIIDFNRTQYIKAVGDGVANIMPVTVGTSFQVIPRVINTNGGSQIHLIVDIEDGNFSEVAGGDIAYDTPDVRKARVSTQAVIAEKQSLVIGGFHVAEEVDRVNSVPLLSRTPLIGKALFSSTITSNNRRERLFILTPRLVGDQVNPVRYLPQSDQDHLSAAFAPLARRRAEHLPIVKRADVAETLANLVTGQVPKKFKAGPMPTGAGVVCKTPSPLSPVPGASQWYSGALYNVAVLVLHNKGDRYVRIDESECSNEHTLAVSIWPQAWLAPGEKAEVFIATRTRNKNESTAVTRPSLLAPAARSTPK